MISIRHLLQRLGQLGLLGLMVGLVCWPFNLLDRWGDQLLGLLPAFSGQPWQPLSLSLACTPLLVVPLLLWLQSSLFQRGRGSGIPQAMTSIEHPEKAAGLLGLVPSLQRLLLWGLATISLLPLGREGPVVQVGASAALWFRRLFPRWLGDISHADLLAVAGGAGLAGGFNTPLLGVVFVAEEFMGTFSTALIWPALVVGALAAVFSSLVGEPEFALGMVGVAPAELDQLVWALPLGALAGGLGAVFARLLLRTTRRWRQLSIQRPLHLGLAVGGLITAFLLISGGAAGCDGELLMTAMINGSSPTTALLPGVFGDLLTLVLRVVAPVLALGTGIPGGLIDPSFAFGAVLGHGLGDLASAPQLGLTLGMVAGLAGATQLPVLAVLFGVRMAGDQQLLPGLLLAAVVAAYVSRCLVEKPVYHALKDIADEPLPAS
ncbi:chloride channel protein [Synechococcus sp. CB0101]|uniref:chloride channel protein n=1 Tax=Synechococcus sp. CB0101 TaxID=232348 RepID=UPI0002002ECB|nr:chloride channel protein [Synechococcus sp. CB0101]QCH13556.1 chloride channel protein [Synechococcus sp. CB0101]